MTMWLVFMCLPFILIEGSKYHQSDYTVKITRVEIINYNRSYLTNVSCGLVHYNRTYRAVNASLHLHKEIRQNLKLAVQIYKFLSNEYRFFPITAEENICVTSKLDLYGMAESVQNCVNIPLRPICPIKPGILKMTYGMFDFSKFPPLIPGGQYKAQAKLYDNANYIFTLDIYGQVDEILKLWD